MKALSFYLLLPFIYFISILPFPILYLLSDGLFLLLFHLIKYRKKIVLENLRNSFPEKTDKEIQKICVEHYKYFADLIVETCKVLTIGEKELVKRCKFTGGPLLESLYAQKRSILVVLGHYGNWEWAASATSLQTKHKWLVVYRPLSNIYFDRLLFKARSRFGTDLVSMKDTLKKLIITRDLITCTALVSDQTPPPENAYWTTFLNQETSVFNGPERIAKKLNYPVVFGNMKRIRRGYYEMHTEMLLEDPKFTQAGEISEAHTKRLEQEIIKSPETWLWTHRRWKRKRNLIDAH